MSRTLILIRHGKPLLSSRPLSLTEYLTAYDAAGIDPKHPPPQRLQSLISDCRRWYCSPLLRARHSMETLLPQANAEVSALFREAPLPVRERPPFIPLTFWLAYLRGRWMQGKFSAEESLEDCRARAREASDFITATWPDDDMTAIMGHGFFNFLMAEVLTQRGWTQSRSERGYWSTRILTRPFKAVP